ncbi:hypothetical protein RI367_005474 [Sorochytrium milnesiophthora]
MLDFGTNEEKALVDVVLAGRNAVKTRDKANATINQAAGQINDKPHIFPTLSHDVILVVLEPKEKNTEVGGLLARGLIRPSDNRN